MRKRQHDHPSRVVGQWAARPEFFTHRKFSIHRALVFPLLNIFGFLYLCAHSGALFAQCNPAGNPTRYEYTINPTSMLNIVGQEFCTSQSMGTNCCGAQPSYRCLDLVFNLENGPLGEPFGESCQGMVNLLTANGNFDALFFNVGTPNPAGNATGCGTPIKIDNNHIISVAFSGNATGQINLSLIVIDNKGDTIYNANQVASPGQAVILTICKPGFGCLEDEIIFGCCEASASLALAPGAPPVICTGSSTSLKVTGSNGTPPYTVMVRAASTIDTTYVPIQVPDDLDGNSLMDMITTVVSPVVTTTYTALSVEDDGGCVQPLMGQSVTITVNPVATVFAGNDQMICQDQYANLAASLGGSAMGGNWSGGSGVFANASSPITTYTPAPGEYGTTVALVFTTNDPPGPCPAVADTLSLTINRLPVVHAGKDIMICFDENLDLAQLGASIQPNGSGVSTGVWSSSGAGAFLPNTAFPTASTYVPSAADRAAGFVTLTLTSADPLGPCLPVSDQAVLSFKPSEDLVCNDSVIIALDEDGMVEILPDMILESDYVDSMFIVQVFLNGVNIGNTVNCSHVGLTLPVRIIDKCTGLYCTGSVTVVDNLPPVMECADIELICAITNLDPVYLQTVLGVPNVYPIITDNCGQYTLSRKDYWVNLSCDDDYIGYLQRVWTATDGSGNKSTCTQYLNFLHQYVTDVKFPADTVLPCSNGPVNTTPAVAGAPYLTAYNMNFPILPNAGYCKLAASFTDNTLPSCDGTYDIIRTWVVYDMCSPTGPGNPKYHNQIIRVYDNTGPVFNCPDDLTVSTDPLDCCATVNLPDIIAEDICSRIRDAQAIIEVRHPVTGDILTTYNLIGSLTSFPGNNLNDPDTLIVFGLTPCLPPGTHTVTYYAEDDCINTSYCSFELTIEDKSPPVPACDEITQVSLGIDGMIFVNASTFDDGSYDNCSDVYFKARRLEANTCQPDTLFYDQVKFCCEDINDTVLVILRIFDAPAPPGPLPLDYDFGNHNDCQVQVYIEDKLKPSCVPPPDATVSCENFDPSLWAYGMATGVDNCCVDTVLTQVNYNLFDTVCNKGTITRVFRVVDCGGQSNQCTQRIYVSYEQDYYIKFPDDVIVTFCAASDLYGEPELFGEDCELIGISYQDEVFTVVPDACFKIERTWTIINWCTFDPNQPCIFVPNPNPNAILNHPSNLTGPVVSAANTLAPWAPTVVKVSPGDPVATNYSTFWSANANCYKYKQIIKITDTQKPDILCPLSPVEVCDLTTNDAQLWNETYWFEPATGSHDLCEAPADLCITATDACSGANINIRYLFFLDLDHNGDMETVINSVNPPDAGSVLFGNAASPNYLGGVVRNFDSRPVSPDQKYRFSIQTTDAGFNKIACVRWNTAAAPDTYTLPQLPHGVHKIKWIVEDGCGNEQVCEYTFIVKDCKPPTVTCLNGVSVNLMPTAMISMDYQTLVKDVYDNCTPPGLLIFGIRKAGTGNGFPFNPDGTPQTNVVFDCSELGTNLVEIWIMDLAGNTDYCTTYILVQDNAGICNTASASIAGMLQTEHGDGLQDVNVQIQGILPNGLPPMQLLALSDNNGHYLLPNAVPMAANAMVSPFKDNDPLNGVSTFDLVLINKHILGLAPLGSPYKMIAADANNSRSITTFDIVELRKLILGLYSDFPQNTSWRFVDKSYQFPEPSNPFQEVFPETKTLNEIQTHLMEEDFVAVKTGDVNGSAVANSLYFVQDRSAGTLFFDMEDRLVESGEILTITLKPSETVSGFQFTLYHKGLELTDILPGDGMSTDNFGIFAGEQAVTISFNTPGENGNIGEFQVVFRAVANGKLSQMLRISSQITRAEAYRELEKAGETDYATLLDVGLRFHEAGGSTVTGVGFELYQNQPNPWTNTTRVDFHLPEPANTVLTVYDETGRILYSKQGYFHGGYNSLTIDNAMLEESGMLYYKIETDTDRAARKMVRLR